MLCPFRALSPDNPWPDNNLKTAVMELLSIQVTVMCYCAAADVGVWCSVLLMWKCCVAGVGVVC
jgi:hypothetical protein